MKSKVVLLDKWHISDKTEFCEKVPFSPGESGTFKISGFLVINRFSVKSNVVLLDKWHISGKTEFYEKVPFSPGESGTFNLSDFLITYRFSVKSKVTLVNKWHISYKFPLLYFLHLSRRCGASAKRELFYIS